MAIKQLIKYSDLPISKTISSDVSLVNNGDGTLTINSSYISGSKKTISICSKKLIGGHKYCVISIPQYIKDTNHNMEFQLYYGDMRRYDFNGKGLMFVEDGTTANNEINVTFNLLLYAWEGSFNLTFQIFDLTESKINVSTVEEFKAQYLSYVLKDIADSIRDKKGTTGKINVQDFSNEIKNIEVGIIPNGNINIVDTTKVDVANYETAQIVDENLKAENIKKDVTILGITGTAEGEVQKAGKTLLQMIKDINDNNQMISVSSEINTNGGASEYCEGTITPDMYSQNIQEFTTSHMQIRNNLTKEWLLSFLEITTNKEMNLENLCNDVMEIHYRYNKNGNPTQYIATIYQDGKVSQAIPQDNGVDYSFNVIQPQNGKPLYFNLDYVEGVKDDLYTGMQLPFAPLTYTVYYNNDISAIDFLREKDDKYNTSALQDGIILKLSQSDEDNNMNYTLDNKITYVTDSLICEKYLICYPMFDYDSIDDRSGFYRIIPYNLKTKKIIPATIYYKDDNNTYEVETDSYYEEESDGYYFNNDFIFLSSNNTRKIYICLKEYEEDNKNIIFLTQTIHGEPIQSEGSDSGSGSGSGSGGSGSGSGSNSGSGSGSGSGKTDALSRYYSDGTIYSIWSVGNMAYMYQGLNGEVNDVMNLPTNTIVDMQLDTPVNISELCIDSSLCSAALMFTAEESGLYYFEVPAEYNGFKLFYRLSDYDLEDGYRKFYYSRSVDISEAIYGETREINGHKYITAQAMLDANEKYLIDFYYDTTEEGMNTRFLKDRHITISKNNF